MPRKTRWVCRQVVPLFAAPGKKRRFAAVFDEISQQRHRHSVLKTRKQRIFSGKQRLLPS